MKLKTTLSAIAFASATAAAAEAHGETGLQTGSTHVVAVSSSPTAGLEAGMPRTGAYARAIALDAQSKWVESERLYRTAAEEFRRMLGRRPQWQETIKGWISKAEFQVKQSRKLRQQSIYYRPRWRHRYISAHTYYYRAVAKHNKWLGIRAFTGRAPRRLVDEAIADYKGALRRRSGYTLALIALGALYHEIGEHDLGRQQFAKLRSPPSRWMAVNVAYYHAASGSTDKALEQLEKAVRYSSSVKRHVLQANEFDRLRAHPRFRRLFGR